MIVTAKLILKAVALVMLTALHCYGSFLKSHAKTRSMPIRYAHHLTSALENLAFERRKQEQVYEVIQWFDPKSTPSNKENLVTLPLYPLSEVYLPTRDAVNYTFNNIEPRNIEMALSFLEQENPRFCATLRAFDTGSLATVGTIMRVLHVEPHYDIHEPSEIRRMTLTCAAEEIAGIDGLVNPHAASPEYRARRSPVYLRARVSPLDNKDESVSVDLAKSTANEFNIVRRLYLNGAGSRNLPPFSHDNLSNALPEVIPEDFVGPNFWKIVQLWQTLCYTVREGQQILLSTTRNEIMVAAAVKKGGPLKLPIHMEDLEPPIRRTIEEIEIQTQTQWIETGLDPTLDFQLLLSLSSDTERLSYFLKMIKRERKRLDSLEESDTQINTENHIMPRRGAWFNDTAWE